MTARRQPVWVETRRAKGVARITVRPGRPGPTADAARAQALVDACGALALDESVRVVVLLMGGRFHDLALAGDGTWLPTGWPDVVAAMAQLTQPVVVGLDGPVRGLGLGVALTADVRVLSTRATLVVAGSAADGFPGGGLTQRLPRLVGVGRAMELLMLGGRLDAPTALAWGLATDVVPSSSLTTRVMARAAALATRAPVALAYAKEAVRRALDLPLADGARLEHDLYVLLQTTADRREGVRAFLERRDPRFRGR